MHSALASAVGHGSPVLAFVLITVGGLVAFRTWLGVALVAAGLLIVPWHYLAVAAILGAGFAVLLFISSFSDA